eukprot:TRINITY_DN7518_c0_g1_i1.p2 TRINITY_DN7518_c0_g1~~TRINITY_DN7518_c0_g1_i1.p2  ORF type:complete len:74 (-),score=2.11 TRINITY_DN7518_c0_g1_i1:34-255(-)
MNHSFLVIVVSIKRLLIMATQGDPNQNNEFFTKLPRKYDGSGGHSGSLSRTMTGCLPLVAKAYMFIRIIRKFG